MHAEAGVGVPGPVPCITLSHTLPSTEAVDRVMAEAASAGSHHRRRARHPTPGRYSGYFADPDGFRWEIASNPT